MEGYRTGDCSRPLQGRSLTSMMLFEGGVIAVHTWWIITSVYVIIRGRRMCNLTILSSQFEVSFVFTTFYTTIAGIKSRSLEF